MICAERWTKGVASFVQKFLHSPLLLFTSFLESALYAQVPMYAHVCDEVDKKQKLLEILENARKTVICMSNSSKAAEIHNFLKCENVRSFLITEEMEHYISDGVIQDWKCVKSTVAPHCLVVTDKAFTHMSISSANYLIHYDVPEMSRLQFGNRFSCIAEHFKKLNGASDCVCHILVSEDCSLQAPSLLQLIKRSGVAVSADLQDLVSKKANVKNEKDSPLCHYMKAFGSCKLPNCQHRHHINPITDKPDVITSEGDVHGLVTHICDASHFFIRVLKYLPPDMKQASSMSGSYAKIGFQMKKFFSLESNRQKVEQPVVGKNYVLQEENELFYRVKVLDIIPASQAQRQKLKLLFRDEAWVQTHDNFQLFEYIDADQFPPPLALEVYLCGVSTPDTCLDWNPQANRFISNLIKDREVHGKIVLCLGETVWLHPVVLREKLVFINDYLNIHSLDKCLKDAGFATDNKSHLPLLIEACDNKIPVPKTIKVTTQVTDNENEPPLFSYAFLELNICEDVFVSSVVSPHEFYVQRAKFVACLDEQQDKIGSKIEAKVFQKCSTLQNGMHCIALFEEDNRYYRGLVTEVIPDSDDAQVFFLDFGDCCRVARESTFVLPSEFSLLPFQAIKCELNGICAPHGGWTDKAGDTLYNLTRNEDGDMKILKLQAYKKSEQYGDGNHYIVDLWNCEKSVSEQLLEAGLVSPSDKFSPVDMVPAETAWEDKEIFEDVADGYVASSDEDLSEEEKVIQGNFFLTLAKLMYGPPEMEVPAGHSAPENKKVQCLTEDKNTENASENKTEKTVEEVEITPVSRSPFQSLQKLMNLMHNEPKRAKPFIKWWNTVEHVHILINLRDIQLYELELLDDRFTFKTSLRGMEYYTEEELYSSVYSDEAVTKNTVLGLNITLKKQMSVQWPRLTKQKLSHIKYDLDHLDSDSEEATKEEIPVPEIENPEESMVAHYDSEEEKENTDDEDEYVQPWKKLAQFKDPFDPLD